MVQEDNVFKLEVDGRALEVSLWDVYAHEDYDRLRRHAYREATLVLLCFSVTSIESFKHVRERWFPEVLYRCSSPKIPLVLVGCKSDLKTERTVTRDQGLLLAEALGSAVYVECSACTKEGVCDVKEMIGAVLSATSRDPVARRDGCVII